MAGKITATENGLIMHNRFFIPLLFASTVVSAVAAASLKDYEARTTPLEGATPAQWRVIWKADPAHEATISWSTARQGRSHVVHWDTQSRDGQAMDYAHKISCQRSGEYTRDKGETSGLLKHPPAWFHHARLQKLPADSVIYFVMVSDGRTSREFHFRTAPDSQAEFSILSGGDSRSGHLARCRMNEVMARLTDRLPELIAFAHGGDFIASGRKWKQWSQWLSHHELCTAKNGRLLPLIVTRGNHDPGPLFNEIFDFPPGDQNYYTTRINGGVSLVTLNSNIPAAGDQRVFLEKELEALRPRSRWLLVQYHRPVFPVVKKPGEGRQAWVPLFEKYNVDLALESDGHNLKRTVPIRNEKHDPTGVVYVGEGGLGVSQRSPDQKLWYVRPPGMSGKGHHVFLLDFSADKLRSRVLRLEGGVTDDYTLNVRQ